ncbi:MAG: hypothetical protein AB3N17_03880 [Tateyamaria sp.]
MRNRLLTAFSAAMLLSPATAQETPPDGAWGNINGLDSADLALRGWDMIGTTALQAGSNTGLLVTFWRAGDGTLARCVFSLVNPTGAEQFESCSVAVAVNGEPE